jgi:hypothetical protein
MARTIEQLTALLRRGSINPDGHGERIGETREQHVERILNHTDERDLILGAIPAPEMNREEIE